MQIFKRQALAPKNSRSSSLNQLPSPVRVLVTAWLLFGCLGSIWSFASPLMSVPDEPAHAIKAAAVARGQFSGSSSGIQGEPLTVNVPGYIAHLGEYSCFAQKSDVTPDCSQQIDAGDRTWIPAKTSAGNYNPVYYAIVGLGSRGLSGEPAIYAMRLINTWLVSFFLASIFCAAASLRRFQRPVIAGAIALTPSVFFLTGAINPNALEIAASGAVFMSLCAILEQSARKTKISSLLLVIFALAGALLAHTRPLSLLWLAIAALSAMLCHSAPALFRALRDRRAQAAVLAVGLSCSFALWWVVSAKSFESLLAGSESIPADVAAVEMVDKTVAFMAQYVGVLGWLDTQPPVAATYAWVLGFGAMLLLAYTSRPVRGRWAMVLLTLTVLVIPVVLQASSSEQLGWIWQGRYALAMVVTMILAAGVTVRFRPYKVTPWGSSLLRWSIVLAILAHTYVFLEGMRRYTLGIQDHVNWTEMLEPLWQPPGTWQGLTAMYLLVLAVSGLCLHRWLTIRPSAPRPAAADRQPRQDGYSEPAADLPASSKVFRQDSIDTRSGRAER
ncbi:DUF2142 domain-containing protein [Arthrobacter sp. ZBG10]|uniref:DUF2142 domain-containing protein n=1 Tax=Arthrobacter sp. ZBG10 TaxID=1676590 RepID=UPI0009E326D0|nr:DUF2142 domain-containing protein [Arthrobacter sp. ZBG10]